MCNTSTAYNVTYPNGNAGEGSRRVAVILISVLLLVQINNRADIKRLLIVALVTFEVIGFGTNFADWMKIVRDKS